ncbi:Hypothetical predicted protein [Pelobates cultripes]|uniref:Uncharacterized protein n=1 Tax=Pelobates cultripes TaxID=61616 RepID=A0AAD1WIY7_PELCU|nr:Hypothetical predicted protein [Pelobates cultripes]
MDSPDALAEAGPTCSLAVDAGRRTQPVIQPRSPAEADLSPPFGLLGVITVHHGNPTNLSLHMQALLERRGQKNAATPNTSKMAAVLTAKSRANTLPHTSE